VPHGILGVFNTILYENEFQDPQKFPTDHQSFSRAIYFSSAEKKSSSFFLYVIYFLRCSQLHFCVLLTQAIQSLFHHYSDPAVFLYLAILYFLGKHHVMHSGTPCGIND
jgi:hypothetical protein